MAYGVEYLVAANLWPIACLSGRPQLLIFCACDQALNQDAGIQPADSLPHSYRPVVGCVCGITPLEYGSDQRRLP